MPQEHGRFDYSAIVDRKPLRWPNGARVAVWVIPNIEHFLFDRPGDARQLGGGAAAQSRRAQLSPGAITALRVGIWRMMEVMERYGVKGTVALNSDVCRQYPRIIEAGNALGWEWMGHGTTNSILLNAQTEDEERALVRDAVETIAKGTGKRPKGWLSPASANGAHARPPRRARHRVCRQLGQ